MVRPSLLAAVVFIAVPQAHASEPCATVAAQAVTVAPFAIPVAVPVAVVQQPTLFYGYGRYVPATTVDPAANAARPTNTAPAVADAPTVSIGALLKKHCAECHQGATARGGLQLFAADGSPPMVRRLRYCPGKRSRKRARRPTAPRRRCRRRVVRRSRRRSKRSFAAGPCRRRRCVTEWSIVRSS